MSTHLESLRGVAIVEEDGGDVVHMVDIVQDRGEVYIPRHEDQGRRRRVCGRETSHAVTQLVIGSILGCGVNVNKSNL